MEVQFCGIIILRERLQGPGEILYISVGEKQRNKGIGRGRIVRSARAGALRINVAETDNMAVGFYKKCGFSIRSIGEKYQDNERFHCTPDIL